MPEDLVGPEIEGYIGRARPGFFFNVCHGGQQGWALTRLGGWANRLVSAGAGLFIAPLWSVTDANALAFAAAFYTELLTGATVGEAAVPGRLAARTSRRSHLAGLQRLRAPQRAGCVVLSVKPTG